MPPTAEKARFDAVTALSIYLTLLLVIPASMRIEALGSAGGPATLFAIAVFCWWLWSWLQRTETEQHRQSIRLALWCWMSIMLVAYVTAMAGPIPSDEVSPADSGMMRVIGLAGLVLAANDGIRSRDRARRFLNVLTVLVALFAGLALVQYFTGQIWIDRVSIPGLTSVVNAELGVRSGIIRASSTSISPIELSVVLGMALPLSILVARHAQRHRRMYAICVVLIAAAAMVSLSRSALICSLVSMTLAGVAWNWQTRIRALVLGLVGLVAAYLAQPGLLRTLSSLFTGAGEDASVQSRLSGYDFAFSMISHHWWFGRGFGTFLPKYRILDNSWLGQLIEVGVIGTAALLALVVVTLVTARRTARLAFERYSAALARGDTAAAERAGFDREVAWAGLAAVASGAVGFAFFDGFAFPQTVGIWFVCIGLVGSIARIARNPESPTLPLVNPNSAPLSVRRGYPVGLTRPPGVPASAAVPQGQPR